eukprot:363248-Chlamydomonas_euryale.AAC.8
MLGRLWTLLDVPRHETLAGSKLHDRALIGGRLRTVTHFMGHHKRALINGRGLASLDAGRQPHTLGNTHMEGDARICACRLIIHLVRRWQMHLAAGGLSLALAGGR